MSRPFDIPARIAIERSGENLFAHVDIDAAIGPGDCFLIHGAPIRIGFGERAHLVRTATVRRASLGRRLWTRFAGNFALTALYEVSFSGRRLP